MLAFVLSLSYAAWLQPEWEPSRDDQRQYLALARGLAERGEFTRAAGDEPFIAEPLRTPGYPVFVAALCRSVGCGHWQVAITQALLSAATVILTWTFAVTCVSPHAAKIATFAVALYPLFAYFAALTLSETLATFLVLAGINAFRSGGTAGLAVAGAAFGAAAVTRPLFLLIPFPLALAALLAGRERKHIALFAGMFLLLVVPSFLYSFNTLGKASTSSAGSQLWLGYFQGRDPSTFDAYVREHADAGAKTIARFVALEERAAQPAAFVAMDAELGRRAVALIAHDPVGYVAAAIPRSIVLWAGAVPVREGLVIPQPARLAVLTLDLVLLILGSLGAIVLARRGTALPLLIIGYVWLLSIPFWTEPRFSLPARPMLFIAAIAGALALRRRSGARKLDPPTAQP